MRTAQMAARSPVITPDDLKLARWRLLDAAVKSTLRVGPHSRADLVNVVTGRVAGHEHFRGVDKSHLGIRITNRIATLHSASEIEKVPTAPVETYRLPPKPRRK